ncbi:MAG TPA: RNA polymerase sigma factor [Solirubrobacteraceae bacterium]|nr:RNA polymerase sigma factor [Solirubrobacteraceae bacterium]
MLDLSEREDWELADAARKGDREAFAVLYHRFKSDVWNLAYLTMRSRHEAEDCVQETFVRALRALRRTPEISSVRAWLLTICRNVCLDRIRASRRHLVSSLDDDVAEEPVARARDEDLHIDFYRALRELPEADRQAFILVDVLGCRSHEAASILGLDAPSTLRSRLAKARRQLAPAVTDAEAVRAAAEIWGVYHAPSSSAIVATYGDGTAARLGALPLKQLIRDLSHPRDGDAAEMLPGLTTFFERLDDRIPHTTPVMAAITGDGRPEGNSALHWLENHPRWRVRRQPTHAAWLLEVQSLLEAAGERSRFPPLTALHDSSTTSFLWTAAA